MAAKVQICYDGQCPFCTRTIRWLDRLDQHRRIDAIPLTDPGPYVRLQDEDGNWGASTAVLRALMHVGGRWRILGRVLLWIPVRWRDWVYNQVAARRRRVTAAEAARNTAG